MIKQAPSLPRLLVIVSFSLSCFGLLIYLWHAFGGPMPLQPRGYRFSVAIPNATTLATQADVRIAGINVGKVVGTERDRDRTKVTIELQRRYAPVPADSVAMVRTKTVLGESYVQLSRGSPSAPMVPEGGILARGQVRGTVAIDDFLGIFDAPTRRAYRRFTEQLARQVPPGVDRDLNAALGDLPAFADDGRALLTALESRGRALEQLVRNTGVVFGALARRRGELRQLQVNGNRFFSATAQEHDALATTIQILPTFLAESTSTVKRLERFAHTTHPLVRELMPVAGELGPTLRELGAASGPLTRYFRLQKPLLAASRRGLPAATRLLDGTIPLLGALRPFLDELNPAVGFLNFNRDMIAGLLGGGSGFAAKTTDVGGGSHHYLRSYGIVNDRSVSLTPGDRQSPYTRGNAYVAPNAYRRLQPLGILESWDCSATGGLQRDPVDGLPPCFDAPPSLWDGKLFPRLVPGLSPVIAPPTGLEGTRPPQR